MNRKRYGEYDPTVKTTDILRIMTDVNKASDYADQALKAEDEKLKLLDQMYKSFDMRKEDTNPDIVDNNTGGKVTINFDDAR